jgi:segregation and condensation protein B
VKIVGQKEAPGRPNLYSTTKQFLDYFNITTLNDLPTLQEIQDLDLSLDDTPHTLQAESENQESDEQADLTQTFIKIPEELGETAAV